MAYQPNIPTGSVPLNQDFLNIQGNFSSLNTQFNEDHVPLTSTSGTPPNGYHKAIHLVPQAPPAAVAGYGELYARNLNDGSAVGEQLWYQFVNGSAVTINFPITRNFQPSIASPGYTFLPGGLIFQWGSSVSDGSGNIPFPLTFPVASFTPVVTFAPASGPVVTLISSVTAAGFTINRANVGVTWMAIGN